MNGAAHEETTALRVKRDISNTNSYHSMEPKCSHARTVISNNRLLVI